MKSPWKLLTQLTSRKRQTQPEDRANDPGEGIEVQNAGVISAPAVAAQITALEAASIADKDHINPRVIDTEAEPAPETSSVSSSGETGIGAPETDADFGQAPAEAGTVPSKSRAGLSRKRGGDMAVRSVRKADGKDQGHSLSSATAAVDPLLELDGEITHLRIQLAGKLRLQNAQLKAMLARFD